VSSASLQIVFGKYVDLVIIQELWIEYGRSGSPVFTAISGGNIVATSSACPVGAAYHVCLIRTGSTGAWSYTFIINGRVDTVTSTAANPNGSGQISISNTTFPFSGAVDDLRCGPSISVSAAIRLTSRRGIAYELAPRRRSALVAGFNRRRRLLVGAGS
jgi:hypothetical protein